MMKVKPFNYHKPPRRKTYCTTSAIETLPSPTASSLAASRRTDFYNDSYTCSNSNNGTNHIINDGKSKKCRGRGNSHISPTSSTAHYNVISLCSLCGVGGLTAALTLIVLIGFIGVAGQGKLNELHGGSISGSRFPVQTHHHHHHHLSLPSLSYQSLTSLSNVGADNFDQENDAQALQLKIHTMGQFGIKYVNDSYNYSRNHSPHYSSLQEQQQKAGVMGTRLSSMMAPVDESLLLSLPDEDGDHDNNNNNHDHVSVHVKKDQSISSSQNNSNENKLKNSKKFKRKKNNEEDRKTDVMLKYENVSKEKTFISPKAMENVPGDLRAGVTSYSNKYRSYNLNNAKPVAKDKQVSKIYFDKHEKGKWVGKDNIDADKYTRDKGWLHLKSDSGSGNDADVEEEDEDDDDLTLERFMPGNSSHTSGKLRFRQGSQAEIDILDSADGVYFPSVPSTTKRPNSSRRRPRRSVVHLYDMVVCSTGCNPLIFKGYGCYCGFLGSGLTVDGIDKCCAKHDYCYHHAKCPPLLTYFVPYYWRCDHGRPTCVTDFRGWKGVCGAHLCECDRQFAECLKKFPCPRSRAMCVTSPWSNHYSSDPRSVPFTVGRRPPPPPWQLPPQRYAPLFHFPPPHSPLSPLSMDPITPPLI